MPHIIVHVTKGRTDDQKRELVRRLTNDIVDVFGAVRDHTNVLIHEYERIDVARGGIVQVDRMSAARDTPER